MEDDSPEEFLAEFKEKHLGAWGIVQITAGTGLAVYAMWAGVLMPGFRKVPLRLQVPYLPASKKQMRNVMTLLSGRHGNLVDLGSGDGRIVLEAHKHGFGPTVGYELNPWLVRLANFHAWRAGHYGKVSYRQEDLWKVDLTECKNVTVFLAPSVVSLFALAHIINSCVQTIRILSHSGQTICSVNWGMVPLVNRLRVQFPYHLASHCRNKNTC
uniref:Adenine nucleotide translocase lysine methyltransferase n=1 Tax=Hucho hucho TaxID=62062 RepID=A0A4W5KCP1_9TELE